ncbi:Nuclear mitotic apparatus protein 1 [Lemmus lemmus]
MEKAKTHYDAKKQENKELQEQLRDLEQLQKENKELHTEVDHLGRELQHAGLKTKEAEQACRHLSAQCSAWRHRLPMQTSSVETWANFRVYFYLIRALGQVSLGSSLDSLGDAFPDSGHETYSARQCTTQIINITMTKKLDVEEPASPSSSFYSTQSAPAPQASLRATSSTQSLVRLGSPDDGILVPINLPGSRPTTRISAHHSETKMSSGAYQ